MEDEKQSLIKQKQEGDALRELQLHHGWKEFTNILEELYMSKVTELLDEFGTDPQRLQAYSMLKALETISDAVNAKIQFGKVAVDELKKSRFNLTQATP